MLTVQLNRVYQPADPDVDRRWSQVREAQRQVARQVPGIGVVPALDLPLSDQIHTSPAGNMLLGERLAQAALGLVYGQAVAWQAPDLAAARRRGDRVELEFAAVESRMDSIDLEANSFRVEDAAGEGTSRGGDLSPGPSRRTSLGATFARGG